MWFTHPNHTPHRLAWERFSGGHMWWVKTRIHTYTKTNAHSEWTYGGNPRHPQSYIYMMNIVDGRHPNALRPTRSIKHTQIGLLGFASAFDNKVKLPSTCVQNMLVLIHVLLLRQSHIIALYGCSFPSPSHPTRSANARWRRNTKPQILLSVCGTKS